MPEDYPDYPSNKKIHGYMQLFADAYGLRDHIRFNTSVEKAELQADGSWQVKLSTGETKRYGSLVCANGTNWHPVMPDYPGSFTGEMRHAVTFRSMDEFRGKRVLVIGAGNSGCDIACDAAKGADAAFISLRRGYHFLPKHLFGIPADVFAHEGPHLPMWLTQRIFGVILRILNGDLTRLGLQKPDHRLFETHPILNTQLLHYLGHGDIKAKPDVERFEGKTVHFKDGTSEEIDLVLCATGYTWKVPYVDPSVFTWKSGKPDLYMNLFSREHPTLYALGFMETNGGAYKLFDEMADMIARTIMVRAKASTARRPSSTRSSQPTGRTSPAASGLSVRRGTRPMSRSMPTASIWASFASSSAGRASMTAVLTLCGRRRPRARRHDEGARHGRGRRYRRGNCARARQARPQPHPCRPRGGPARCRRGYALLAARDDPLRSPPRARTWSGFA